MNETRARTLLDFDYQIAGCIITARLKFNDEENDKLRVVRDFVNSLQIPGLHIEKIIKTLEADDNRVTFSNHKDFKDSVKKGIGERATRYAIIEFKNAQTKEAKQEAVKYFAQIYSLLGYSKEGIDEFIEILDDNTKAFLEANRAYR